MVVYVALSTINAANLQQNLRTSKYFYNKISDIIAKKYLIQQTKMLNPL